MLRARRRVREAGAAMTEYVIIVALIAIFAIAAVELFGGKVSGLFQTGAMRLNEVQLKMNMPS